MKCDVGGVVIPLKCDVWMRSGSQLFHRFDVCRPPPLPDGPVAKGAGTGTGNGGNTPTPTPTPTFAQQLLAIDAGMGKVPLPVQPPLVTARALLATKDFAGHVLEKDWRVASQPDAFEQHN